MKQAVGQGLTVIVLVNNRAGGKAPFIAQEIAEKFAGSHNPQSPQVNL